MKTYLHCAVCALLFMTFSACQSDPFGVMNAELSRDLITLDKSKTATKVVDNQSVDSLSVLLRSLAPSAETFVLTGEKGVTLTTSKGTRIHTGNAVFVNADGEIITRNVTLKIQELHTPSDMLLADKPTNLSRRNGQLESFGEFKITANQNGNPLELQTGSRLTIETEVANIGKKQPKKMPIWDADTTDVLQETRGLNHLAEPTVVRQFFRQKRGAIWQETPERADMNAYNRLQFDLTKLNQWKNCDVFREITAEKATVLIYIAENLAPSVFDGETSTQAAVVYFKPLGINALIKFYQPILNAPTGKSGFYSEENSLPIGTKGTLVAASYINGKLYAAKQNITINAPQGTDKAAFFTLRPTEMDPSVFLGILRDL